MLQALELRGHDPDKMAYDYSVWRDMRGQELRETARAGAPADPLAPHALYGNEGGFVRGPGYPDPSER